MLATTALGVAAVAGAALAAPAQDGAAGALGELVVSSGQEMKLDAQSPTASRLGLSLRETPAVVDVLTQERFLERGLRTSNEALNSAPGVLAVDTGGGPGTYSMRGFTSGSVSINYDGVHQPSTMVTRNYDTFAFDRIEVLKGPSSVLYGEGALGGSVNFVPKKPMFDMPALQGLAQYGSFDTFRVAADANMPLSNKAAARAVVSYAGSRGYIDDTPSNTLTANLGLTWKPSPNVTAFFAAEVFNNDANRTYWGTPLVSANVVRDRSTVATTPTGLVIDKALQETNFQYLDGEVHSTSYWLRSQIEWKISPSWTFLNDLSWNKGDRLWDDAESYTYVPATRLVNRSATYIRNQLDFWIDRATLSSDLDLGGHRSRFLVGYEHTENDHFSTRRFGTPTPVNPYALVRGTFPAITPANFPGAGNFANVAADITINAFLAEEAFNLTDKWLLVGGFRYEDIKLDRTTQDFNLGTVSGFVKPYKPASFRIGTVYDITPKTQVYAQYNKAAAPVSTLVLLNQSNSGFSLTQGKSAEVGLKSSLWNGRLEMTLAGYWIKQDDIITRDPVNPNIQIQGGSQSSRGVELSAAAALTRNLRLDGNVAFVNARFDSLIEAGGLNRAGNAPPNVPGQVYNLFASYQFDGAPVRLTAGVHRSNHLFGDNANTVRVSGYTLFDASVTYQVRYGDITLRARNITNELYGEWGTAAQVYLGAPRGFDLTFRAKL
ncbi:MAG TPA: TonB-dependent siderophore receptor [Caulobacteraceae bacterium]|nr:TonB-dependent siderophore receptor [Caulobacteraceae bacterium]